AVSFYVYALGPTLAANRVRSGGSGGRLRLAVVGLLAFAGVLAVLLVDAVHSRYYQTLVFTSGISLVGSAIMILAQQRRIDLMYGDGNEVFVADALSNILLIASIPFGFFTLGREFFYYVFLWSACLCATAYFALPAGSLSEASGLSARMKVRGLAQPVIGLLLVT